MSTPLDRLDRELGIFESSDEKVLFLSHATKEEHDAFLAAIAIRDWDAVDCLIEIVVCRQQRWPP